ncbi:hypothetical protein GCM10007103_28950 [Salinimicrobium marinum]|uniref:Bacterial sugar transferase domain-containing protein n=1 Tax=Salinimicrobium marinum TaxID=680283 RepID=A0A918W0P4_9FLAO|nr:sugar transferase [Salinimicrobium marinum]GHA46085.1 hypothetical protein GCM10007103_28950 [Salinimicrobium marinum]
MFASRLPLENLSAPEKILFEGIEKEVMDFISKKIYSEGNPCFISSFDYKEIDSLQGISSPLVNVHKVNDARYLNKFFETINAKLPEGGIFVGKVEEYNSRKLRLGQRNPKALLYITLPGDILFNRVFPRLKSTRKIYFALTKGKGRVLSRAETFGRLYSCGFEVIDEKEINNELYFIAQKIKAPYFDTSPSYGPFIKLRRVGKDGKPINVYKLRTMHPFSEYLQEFIFKKNELQEGGKFKNDFRISREGKIFRKIWLDELPMIINLIRGEMKIVGVRPLSTQYFNLYTKELQTKRTKTKPGLLPPFYADMPKTLEEIMASEMKYLEAYEKAPFQTDMKYFWLAVKSILFKGARSN